MTARRLSAVARMASTVSEHLPAYLELHDDLSPSPLRSTSGGGRSSDVSDPTGRIAVARHDDLPADLLSVLIHLQSIDVKLKEQP